MNFSFLIVLEFQKATYFGHFFIFVLFSILKLYIVHIGRILDSPIYLRMTMLDFFVVVSTFSCSLSFPKVSVGNLNLAIVYIRIPSFEEMTR